MNSNPIEICPTGGPELLDGQIDPDWLIEGEPRTRSGWWSGSSDGVDNNYVWDCTAGRFRWYFGCDETVHIIEGEVEVSGDGVPATWLRAGDAALFRSGTWAVWYVPTYVRKHAILRSELPGPLRAQLTYGRRVKRLLGRLRGGKTSVDATQPARSL
jgi:uncharacterized cupin superfamily protein